MRKNLDPSFSRSDWNVALPEGSEAEIAEHHRSDRREPSSSSSERAWLPCSERPEPYEIDWLE